MNIFQKLGEKSWIPHPAGAEFSAVEINENEKAGKIALGFFIAVVSVIFFLITITFLGRSQLEDFQALAGEPWQPFSEPTQLWINTGVLVLSSLALQLAKMSCEKEKFSVTLIAVFVGAFFAFAFLLGQLFVWKHLNELGYFVAANPANSYFYLYTSLHGIHLLGGIVALFYVLGKSMRKNMTSELKKSISLCATYWHFLLIIWLLLFALLTSDTETFRTIAELCGF